MQPCLNDGLNIESKCIDLSPHRHFPFSFPPSTLYAPFAEYGPSSHEHAAATNYHSLYHTRHLWPHAVSLTPPQDGGGNPGGTFWSQQREARPPQPVPPPPQQTHGQITAALATPSPLSSAGSNEENEAAPPVLNNTAAAAGDLCEDDEDPGRNTG